MFDGDDELLDIHFTTEVSDEDPYGRTRLSLPG
jgi:hypothetical protein